MKETIDSRLNNEKTKRPRERFRGITLMMPHLVFVPEEYMRCGYSFMYFLHTLCVYFHSDSMRCEKICVVEHGFGEKKKIPRLSQYGWIL